VAAAAVEAVRKGRAAGTATAVAHAAATAEAMTHAAATTKAMAHTAAATAEAMAAATAKPSPAVATATSSATAAFHLSGMRAANVMASSISLSVMSVAAPITLGVLAVARSASLMVATITASMRCQRRTSHHDRDCSRQDHPAQPMHPRHKSPPIAALAAVSRNPPSLRRRRLTQPRLYTFSRNVRENSTKVPFAKRDNSSPQVWFKPRPDDGAYGEQRARIESPAYPSTVDCEPTAAWVKSKAHRFAPFQLTRMEPSAACKPIHPSTFIVPEAT
jgi:hypothetical protein